MNRSGEGLSGGETTSKRVPHGEPYAGKLHVRFDEGAGVPCGGVPPYSTPSESWDGTVACSKRPLRLRLRNICGDETVLIA